MTWIHFARLAAGILAATPGTPLAIAQDSEYIFGPEPRYTLCNTEPVPVNAWKDRGFQTPEDAVQTVLWTVRRAGYPAVLPYMPEAERAEFQRYLQDAPPNDDPWQTRLWTTASYQLLAWEQIDEVTMEVDFRLNPVTGHSWRLGACLRQVDGEWKFLNLVSSATNTCLNNLRQLHAAIDQYAIEHDVPDDYRPTTSDILPYLKRAPVCPDYGRYTLGTVQAPVKCSIHGAIE